MTRGLKRLDAKSPVTRRGEVLGFSCVRNEVERLPYFLEYHRRLGVDRFYFVDNASDDGTTEFLTAQPDVHLYWTQDKYSESKCGIDWLNTLLSSHAVGHWTLTLDADEFLVFPHSEEIGLVELTRHLESEGSNALLTFMLDMYSNGFIRDTHLKSGVPPWNDCCYFDKDTYVEVGEEGLPIRGGARHRLFWQDRARLKPSPVLRKLPLVKWTPNLKFLASTHLIDAAWSQTVSGCLLHFKFFSGLYEHAASEALREEHWDHAAQYKAYSDVLEANRDLTAYFDRSSHYDGTQQLVDSGLMIESPVFKGLFSSGMRERRSKQDL